MSVHSENATWTIGTTIEWTADFFSRNRIEDARLEAEILLASVLRYPRLDLYLRHDEIVPPEKLKTYRNLIRERQQRKPVAYILGEQEFMGLRFTVNSHTLIPRPETELLVEKVIALVKTGHDEVVVDLGTGSGNIAVSTARLSPVRRVFATDISLDTLRTAQENIDSHGLAGRIVPKRGDLFGALADEALEGKVDIVVSNPPYISEEELKSLAPELSFEPRAALHGGSDGLDFYRAIVRGSTVFLKSGGYLVMELSSPRSAAIRDIVTAAALQVEEIIKDYAHMDRVIVARKLS